MDIHIPTTEEIYRIAFVTANGWRLEEREIPIDPEYKNTKFVKGWSKLDNFCKDLESAYFTELDLQEKKKQ